MPATFHLHPSMRTLLAILLLLSALVAIPDAASAQVGCAVAKSASEGKPAWWLEGCGRVDPRGVPEQVARRALAGKAALLGLQQDGADLALLAVQKSPIATHVRFAQQHKGVPVYLGQVLVQYSPAGEVQLINNHTLPKLDVDVTPTVDAAAAMRVATAQVPGADQLRAPAEQGLVIYGEGVEPRLAWHIVLYTQSPAGDWHVMVDATSGASLGAWDEIWSDSGGGQAYAANPVQQSGNTALVDNNDATSSALDAARVPLQLNNLSPETKKLKGSYVDITAPGVTGCGLPYTPGLADEPSRVYSYTRADDRFEEVVTYAAIDGVQSWFQSLGFTNVNNRAIPVNVHCVGIDNSYFSSGDGALHLGDGGVDDGEDSDIVVHEYGHAVQADQVPGWGPGSNTEQRAMGEGFGDFLPGMYSIATGNQAFLSSYKYCIGEWDAAAYNPVTPGEAGSGCLRWINGRDEDTNADIGVYSGTPTQEHSDGRYWSAALTCIYEGLGANASARDTMMRLVLQHHFSQIPDASNQAFEQAVQALRLADVTLFDGANQQLIIQCALARGLITTPLLFTPQITAPAEGAQIGAGSAVAISWSTTGNPATATYTVEYSSCAQDVTFNDTVEGGIAGWTVSHNGGSEDWAQVTSQARSATHSWYASDTGPLNDQYLVSPAIQPGSGQQLSFWHRFVMEEGFDGGVVEVSVDGGASWSDLGPQLTLNAYNKAISSRFGSPIAGRQAFSGDSGGWIETHADLTSFAGQTIRLRFRQADDSSMGESGWWVDDISVRNTPLWQLAGTTAAGASSFNWTAPAELGSYCFRVRGQSQGFVETGYSAIRSIAVVDPNTAPTIAEIADLTVYEGAAVPTLSFAVGDMESAPGSLTVTARSSNQALLPDAGIVLAGSGAGRTVTLTPAPGQSGTATVTITVGDGKATGSTSFTLTVLPQAKVYLPLVRR